jgi:phosphohistidine phosphatase
MADQLWLLRHGDAEPHGSREDFDRRLTDRGQAQSRNAGKALRAMELSFTAVVTSPRVRARDTALLACEALGNEPVIHDPLAGGFDGAGALALVGPEHGGRVLIVGHEPDFSSIVHELTGARIDMKKGGVAGIRLGPAPELIALLRPRELAAMAGESKP